MSQMIRKTLRPAAVLGAALLLAACGGADTDTQTTATTSTAATGERSQWERADDHAIGNPDASVVMVEYASVSCPACAVWHNTVYPDIKKKYIDTGKVRFIFREFVASDPTMADTGFKLALCVPEERYFENISQQFKKQAQFFEFARRRQLREAYVAFAKQSGLTEDEFVACVTNNDLRDQYMARMQEGVDIGVTGTPAFVVNGQKVKGSLEDLEAAILPLLGEDAPAPAPESAE